VRVAVVGRGRGPQISGLEPGPVAAAPYWSSARPGSSAVRQRLDLEVMQP
jgi:hypothetical protein